MSEPKLTEALAKALCDWWDDVEGGDDPGHRDSYNAPCDRCRSEAHSLSPTLVRMIAAAPAAARVTALTLRCGQLREQRDEARADVARLRKYRDAVHADFQGHLDALAARNATLTGERDEARAQAVQATTTADDLRARLVALCDRYESIWVPVAGDDGLLDPPHVTTKQVRAALETASGGAGIAHRAANSASVDPSATPDLLGRNGSIQ